MSRLGLLAVVAVVGIGGAGMAPVAHAQKVTAVVDASRRSDPVTRYQYGMFIEPIGGLVARTLWAEMLDDRKFYFPVVAASRDAPPPPNAEGRPGVAYRKWRPIGGDDAALRAVLARARRVAPTATPVLVTGESGTGKELLARALHELGAEVRIPADIASALLFLVSDLAACVSGQTLLVDSGVGAKFPYPMADL